MELDLSRKADRVAIVGFCMPHREWVPYDDEELEIWHLNRAAIFAQLAYRPLPGRVAPADRWFEMHGPAIHEWEQRRPGNHMRFLQEFAGPIYMHQARPDLIPNSVDYPLKEVAEDLGANIFRIDDHEVKGSLATAPYLTSSVNQEIALAIYMGFKEIWLFGIDLNTASEYAWQKPGVEHMLGVAAGRGIKVYLPDICPLLDGPIYGRGYLSPRGEIVSPDQWMERIRTQQEQKRQLERQINEAIGGRREVEWILKQMPPGVDHELEDKRRHAFDDSINKLQSSLLQCVGGLSETLYWAHQTPSGQDPKEALAQLIATVEVEDGKAVDAEATIAGLTAAFLDLTPSEGPEEGTVEAALLDAAEEARELVGAGAN